jgi:hypothetical protein
MLDPGSGSYLIQFIVACIAPLAFIAAIILVVVLLVRTIRGKTKKCP